jgi:ribosomal protein S8E
MKFRLTVATFLVLQVCNAIGAEPGSGCAAKQAEIEANIAAATARGNNHQVAGLNKALRATKANCTEDSLKKEKDARIRKAQKEVAERERDLAKAQRSGDDEKIRKRQAKVEEARRELAEAEKS